MITVSYVPITLMVSRLGDMQLVARSFNEFVSPKYQSVTTSTKYSDNLKLGDEIP